MADKSAGSGRNAAEYFEVRFAEVEALFDLPPYTSLAHGSDGPEVLIGRPGLLGRVEYVGLRGQEVFAPKEANYPTLFVDVRGGTLVRRTFARDRSLTIHDKWVYVLRAEDPGGPATDVVAELSFRNGRFRPVSPGKRGEDPWSTTTKEAKDSEAGALPLQRAPVAQPARPYGYYFHLSPFQIPAQAFGRLKQEAPARAVRIDDSMHVDVHRIGEQNQAESPLVSRALGKKVPADGRLGYRVHLVDPLKEGVRRAQLYSEALDAWEVEERRLGASQEYILAKRIQALTEGAASNLRSLVGVELFRYLGPAEQASARCCLAAHVALGDLLRWIGAEQRPGAYWKNGKAIGAFYEDGRAADYEAPRGGDLPWGNPFSRALRDAWDGETDEARRPFWDTIAFVHHRLDELAAGSAWLERNLDRSLLQASD